MKGFVKALDVHVPKGALCVQYKDSTAISVVLNSLSKAYPMMATRQASIGSLECAIQDGNAINLWNRAEDSVVRLEPGSLTLYRHRAMELCCAVLLNNVKPRGLGMSLDDDERVDHFWYDGKICTTNELCDKYRDRPVSELTRTWVYVLERPDAVLLYPNRSMYFHSIRRHAILREIATLHELGHVLVKTGHEDIA